MNTISFKVENIKCGGCANSIKSGLLSITGVKNIMVDVPEGQITVEGDESMDKQTLSDKLLKMGYPEEGEGSSLATVKSYVSCMIGRIQG